MSNYPDGFNSQACDARFGGEMTPERIEAEKVLDSIIDAKLALKDFFAKISHKINDCGVTAVEWASYSAVIEEQLDEMLNPAWIKNKGVGVGFDYSDFVPHIHDLS